MANLPKKVAESQQIKEEMIPFNNIVRFDQNVAFNLKDLPQNFQDDAPLIRDMILYFANQYKANLFGYCRFTINDFCRIMGYSKNHLQYKHPLIESGYMKAPEYRGHKFESIFEYTLFRIFQQKIVLSRPAKFVGNDMKGVNLKSLDVVSEIQVAYDENKPDRRIYDIRLADTFIGSIMELYVNIDLNDYLSIGNTKGNDKIKNLYLLLASFQHMALSTGDGKMDSVNFDLLCNVAQINAKEPKHRKETLNKYLQVLSNKRSLRYSYKFFVARGQRQAYSLEVQFDATARILEAEKPTILFAELNKKLTELFTKLMETNGMFKNHVDKLMETEGYSQYDCYQQFITNKNAYVSEKLEAIRVARDQAYKNGLKKTFETSRELDLLYQHYVGFLMKL